MAEALLSTQDILKRFKRFKLSRAKLFYIEKYGAIGKKQRVENGRVKNYYNARQIEFILSNQRRRKRSAPLSRIGL